MKNTIFAQEAEIKKLKEEIQRLKNTKKYGLVWEETPEKLDEGNIIPLVKEKKELRILTNPNNNMNYLIEGDNYHSLLALQKTHKNKIDVIYIDPPYNTGNEFVYNDKIVDKEDSFRHSKWLSFMHKRLKLAKSLLSEDGVIFVSIDDNEQAQLKLLMDEVFGEQNFIKTIIIDKTAQGSNNSKTFKTQHEYLHLYVKSLDRNSKLNYNKNIDIDKSKYKYKDDKGYYALTNKFDSINSPLTKNINRGYTIYYHDKQEPIIKEEYNKKNHSFEEHDTILLNKGYIPIRPSVRNNVQYPFNWTKERFLRDYKDELVFQKDSNGTMSIYHKNRYKGEVKDTTIQTFDTRTKGNQLLSEILCNKEFDYPKSLDMMKWVIERCYNKNSIILDFFAGSGTTGHAVMELNKEDGGNRKFILCTNNEVSEEKIRQHFINQGLLDKNTKTAFKKFYEENETLVNQFYESEEYQKLGIARSVTYERLKRVIEGYTTPKGKFVEGLTGNNLIYLQTKELEVKNEITVENSDDVKLYNALHGEDISLLDEVLPMVKLQYVDAKTVVIPIEDTYEMPDLTEEKYKDKSTFVFLVDDSDKEIVRELTMILSDEFTSYNCTIEVTSAYIQS